MSLIQETIDNIKDSTREDHFQADESNGLHFPCLACAHCDGSAADDGDIPIVCQSCRYFFN